MILACRFLIESNLPLHESNWVDQGKLLDHSCRHCPWLPANQHAVITLSQRWIIISPLIALRLLAKSEAIESKLSLVQAERGLATSVLCEELNMSLSQQCIVGALGEVEREKKQNSKKTTGSFCPVPPCPPWAAAYCISSAVLSAGHEGLLIAEGHALFSRHIGDSCKFSVIDPRRRRHAEWEIEIDFWRMLLRSRLWLLLPCFFFKCNYRNVRKTEQIKDWGKYFKNRNHTRDSAALLDMH